MECARLLVMAVLGALSLAGCAADLPHEGPAPASSSPTDNSRFSGPYAADNADAWDEAESDFVRRVIEDEKVSAKEWVQVETRMDGCFTAAGVTFRGHTPDGGYVIQKNGVSSRVLMDLMVECEESSGEAWVGYLWFSAQKNPDHRPIEDIMTECLIRTGVVARDYTADDYVHDIPTLAFPYLHPDDGRKGFEKCNEDPGSGSHSMSSGVFAREQGQELSRGD